MNHSPIYIAKDDYSKLRRMLVIALHSNDGGALSKLGEELDRAAVINTNAVPSDFVTMDSSVEFEDLTTGAIEECTLVFPERADAAIKRVSVLAPLGIALIGCRVGDIAWWATPAGRRQLKVRRVTPAPRASLPAPSLWAPLACTVGA